jgi:hypothetical protein
MHSIMISKNTRKMLELKRGRRPWMDESSPHHLRAKRKGGIINKFGNGKDVI